MTDTGQVPGEGLPESAGMVEQPGVHAHGAYTYLSETTAEDEDLLLLPGAQSPWGNEVAPPAPEPVVEAVHEPGPHETAGRDSGSVDLGGVRLPGPAPAPAPVTPRRPLHLGPPIPDTSASPVRSLADRGPAGAPVRQPATPATGPEYFDAPQQHQMPPQSAAPWGAQAQAAVQAAAPVNAEAPAAETVVPAAEPSAEPVAAAQPALAHIAMQTAPAAQTGDVGVAHGPVGGHVPVGVSAVEGGQAAGGPVAGDGHAAPGGFAASESGHGAPGEFAAQAPPAGATEDVEQGAVAPSASDAGPEEPAASAPETGPAPVAGVAPEAGQPEVPGVVEAVPAPGPEAVPAPVPESGQVPEPTHVPEQAPTVESAPVAEGPAAEAAPIVEPVAAPIADAVTSEGAPLTEAAAPGSEQPAAAVAPEAPQVAVAVAPESRQSSEAVAAGAEQFPEAGADEAVQVPEAVAAEAGQLPEAIAPEAAQLPETVAPHIEQAPAAVAPEAAQAPETVAPDAGQAAHVADPAAPQPVVLEPAQAITTEPVQAVAAEPPHTVEPSAHVPVAAAGATPFPAAPDAVQPVAPSAEATAAPAPSPHGVATEHHSGPVHTTPDAEVHPEATAVAAPAAEPADAGSPADQAHPAEPLAPEPAVVSAGAPPALPADEAADPAQPSPGTDTPQPLAAEPADPQSDASLGQFVLVDGSVPTTPHLAPTPPHALTLPPEAAQAPEPVVKVPAPREADPDLVQHAEDLDTRAADQEEESTAAVEEARQSTGPAAPAYDDAEREAVMKVMRERRDIRNGFRSDPIPHEVLLRVLEAAHTAPSVGHSQPWDFVVIRSADTRRTMHELAMRQRDAYAKSLPKGRAKQFKELKIEAILDTPVNIVVTADPTRGGRHTLGRHTQPQMAPYSAALAVENLWLAARAEGLGVGWVSFFDEREMVRALGLPEHLEVIAYLCVGYVDEFPDEPELMQAGWSKRRPLSWVVHEETYGRRALPGEEPHDLLAETVAQIRPLDAKALGEAWERQKRMTKPAGALGMLEIISAQLSGLSRQCPPPIPEPAAVAIFAGDHGVHAQGVTPWPQEVTAQMVANFLGGGAVCNAFAGQVGAEVCVVDVGVAADLPATPGLLPRKVRAGTSDMTTGPAMTREEAKQAIEVGIETARDLVAAGNRALLTGEMGIANTTASAALISVFTDTDPAEVTGRGTGINDETLARKTEVVRRAIEVHQPDPADPIGVLAAIGGFEHAAMVGLLLGGASLRTPVILDGVSAGAAALVARAIAPEVLAACIAGHRSAEPGHVAALNKLGLRPLVDLDLRLGEGTGALLALPLVQSTARAMHEVATFDSAGVTEK
ncbi:nicotinate-nucleotide--dimethylbenzimidazole phosphoribosyltransferase [Streptomyces sp. NPDC049541]|uniref:nicotinate-nucleotide--dimethylbenzimidazole phosphoribosyltransferase n=1 Tax=Streptomyces sp. NPDC049541 TaxID=3365594 RepID=UPI0037A74DC8